MDTPSATPPSNSSNSTKKILMIVLAVVLGLGLLSMIGSYIAAKAVGFGLKKALEAGGVDIDDRDGVTFSGKDGERMQIGKDGTFTFTDNEGNTANFKAEEGKLPASFSRDFPIHSSMTVQGGSVTQTSKGNLNTGTWLSTATVEELDAFYRRELPTKGWEVKQVLGGSTSAGSLIAFTRGGDGEENEGGQITIQVDEGRVIVNTLFTTRN